MSEAQIHSDSWRAAGDGTEQVRSRSPFQNLMADTLIEICLHAITLYDDSRVDDDVKSLYNLQFTREKWTKAVPVNFSAVCRHWRAVALSSPSLWTNFTGCDDDDMTFPWEYLDMFLLRSRNAHFNLTIRSSNMGYDRLLAVFNNNLSRLKTFDIKCTWMSIPKEPWHIELVNMPSLAIFRLDIMSVPTRDYDTSIYVHLTGAPLLRHLILSKEYALCYNEQLSLENLTHISLSGEYTVVATPNAGVRSLSWHDCLSIMQASPSLEVFLAEDIWSRRNATDYNVVEEAPCITLSKLSDLDLTRHCNESARHLLDHLCLPSLSAVNLNLSRGVSSCGLQALISRSKAVIRKLEVYGIDAIEVAQCLECRPELRSLSVSGYDFDSTELRTLISRLTLDSDTRLCLNLESIAFMDCGDPSQCSEELTRMICSRWDLSMIGDERCLKTVEFEDISEYWDFPYSDELLKACSEGLVIHERKDEDVHDEDESEVGSYYECDYMEDSDFQSESGDYGDSD